MKNYKIGTKSPILPNNSKSQGGGGQRPLTPPPLYSKLKALKNDFDNEVIYFCYRRKANLCAMQIISEVLTES